MSSDSSSTGETSTASSSPASSDSGSGHSVSYGSSSSFSGSSSLLDQIEAADISKRPLKKSNSKTSNRDKIAASLKDELSSLAAIPRDDHDWRMQIRFFVKAFSTLIVLLILVNALGFILWFTSESTTILGSPVVYWALLFDFFVVSYFVVRLIFRLILDVFYFISPIRVLYHLLRPFENNLVVLAVIVLSYVASTLLLVDLHADGEERVEKLFIAFITIAALLVAKRAVVTTIEIMALQEAQVDMNAARFWNKVFEQVYDPKIKSLRRYESKADDVAFSWARPSWLQSIKLASIAAKLRAEGFKTLTQDPPKAGGVISSASGLLRRSRASADDVCINIPRSHSLYSY
eukprot:TRINITY_DN15582_c0_g1_i21.p1 TRINITY_DN15582_c0_g1~~TRINITY_DN15582_c0_g1_i21.p1  ORF type:complete len:348 (+),score=83.79 TRINITY_DN15582_c0_g1_i21:26-1069(+)